MSTPQIKPVATYSGVLGAVLARHRDARGLTQGQLAEAVGLSQSAWSRVENGATSMTADQLALAAAALRSSPGALVADADATAASLRRRGVDVVPSRADKALDGAVVVLGLAALLSLVLVVASKRK